MEGNLKFIDGIIIGTVDEAVFVNGTNKTIAENNPLFECERINLYDKNNPDSHIKVKPNTKTATAIIILFFIFNIPFNYIFILT